MEINPALLLNQHNPQGNPYGNQQYPNNPYGNAPPSPNPILPPIHAEMFNKLFSNDDKINRLVPQNRSVHILPSVATLLLVVSLLFLWGNEDQFEQKGKTKKNNTDVQSQIIFSVLAYFVYLAMALCCHGTGDYLSNIEQGSKFEQLYRAAVNMTGYFLFKAECFHYEYTGGRNNTRNKRITRTDSKQLYPQFTRDESGSIEQINAKTNIIFVEYIVDRRFGDENSQRIYNDFEYNFKMQNNFDQQQSFTVNYVLPQEFKTRRTFYTGTLPYNFKCLYYTCTLLGLALPFSLWIESYITRYEIKINKVITL